MTGVRRAEGGLVSRVVGWLFRTAVAPLEPHAALMARALADRERDRRAREAVRVVPELHLRKLSEK